LNKRFDRVDQQNNNLGNFLLNAKGTISEADRRRGVQEVIRNKWILAHRQIDPDILSGKTMPPDEWVNEQLKAMRENWQIHTAPTPRNAPAQPQIVQQIYPEEKKDIILFGFNQTDMSKGLQTVRLDLRLIKVAGLMLYMPRKPASLKMPYCNLFAVI